jgi:hypothetical protein
MKIFLAPILLAILATGCALAKYEFSGGDGSTESSAIVVPGGCEDYGWYIRSHYPGSSPIKFSWENSPEFSGTLQLYEFRTQDKQLKRLWFKVPFKCTRMRISGARPNNSFKPSPLRGLGRAS